MDLSSVLKSDAEIMVKSAIDILEKRYSFPQVFVTDTFMEIDKGAILIEFRNSTDFSEIVIKPLFNEDNKLSLAVNFKRQDLKNQYFATSLIAGHSNVKRTDEDLFIELSDMDYTRIKDCYSKIRKESRHPSIRGMVLEERERLLSKHGSHKETCDKIISSLQNSWSSYNTKCNDTGKEQKIMNTPGKFFTPENTRPSIEKSHSFEEDVNKMVYSGERLGSR